MNDRPGSSWTRELLELAALFVAVAAADLFANSVAHVSGGALVLTGMGVFLVVCAAAHHRLRHRSPATTPVPELAAPVSVWRVRATVRDTPGSLAELTAGLARRHVNILSVQVHALPQRAVDEFLVEARLPAAELVAAVEAGGGRDVTVARADPHDLVDIPTMVLTMVTRDVAGGIDLARSMRTLLGDCELVWAPGGDPTDGPDGSTLRLPDPEGGVLTVTRTGPAFTPAEFARARALLALDHEFAAWVRAQRSVLRMDSGLVLTVRQAAAADVPAMVAMHGRCSARSRRSRYLSGGNVPSSTDLRRMVHRRHGRTLVAEHPDGSVVATANLMRDGDSAEAALLVEDSWQRKGIGTVLLRGLTSLPGDRHTYAVTEQSNAPMLGLLRHAGAELDAVEDGLARLTIRTRSTKD